MPKHPAGSDKNEALTSDALTSDAPTNDAPPSDAPTGDAEPRQQQPATTPVVLQDWTPTGVCLDFQLGQLAFQRRGAQAFTTHEVPNLVNQGGLSAVRSAEVLFASCAEAEAQGALEVEICGMEMAMGLGLHSVQLLDRFQRRCVEAGKDWYDRLTWFATDITPKMLHDARARGVFDRHTDRVVLAQADARRPGAIRRLDDSAIVDVSGKLRMVVHTYLLCVLPANVFCRTILDGVARWQVLVARTMLRHPEHLAAFGAPDLDTLRTRLAGASISGADLVDLADLYPLLDLDLSLADFDLIEHPDRVELERIATLIAADRVAPVEDKLWVLHSAGAQVSIGSTLDALCPDGVLLYRDYGPGTVADADTPHIYQHYGPTTAIGINHIALDSWAEAADGGAARVSLPEGEQGAAIKTRLIARAPITSVRAAFLHAYETSASEALEAQINNARAAKTADAAIELYRVALRMEPENWALLGEVAEVALRSAQQLDLAEVLIREALRINPWSSAAAWNTLGDVLWFRRDVDGAEAAFRRATEVNPEHARGWFNLYLCARGRADFSAAVEMAARALAVDSESAEIGGGSPRFVAALRDAMEQLTAQRALAVRLRRGRQAGSRK